MSQQLVDVWKGLLWRLRKTWRSMLAANLMHAALGIVLLAPLPGMVMRLLVRMSGKTALVDQDIAYFLLTPFGIVSLVLIAGLIMAIGIFAQGSMMMIGAGAGQRRTSVIDALVFVAQRAGPILAFSTRLVARILLIMIPFVVIGAATVWLLMTDYDINYYLSNRPPQFWIVAGILGILTLAMLVLLLRRLLGWSLALPLVLFAGVSPASSFHRSQQLTQGRRQLVFGVMTVWAVSALMLGALMLWILERFGSWIAPQFFDQLSLLVVVLGALAALWTLLSFLVNTLNAATFALAIVELSAGLGVPIGTTDASLAPSPERVRRWKIIVGRVVALLVAGALVAAFAGAWLLDGVRFSDDVVIVAHRGAAGKAPENTLVAVRQAIEDGADWIEIDVQEAVDGEVVVIHDSDFMKLAGVDLKVWNGSLEQIRSIDVGSWFGPGFAGESVPTLREVLQTARGKARVVIELKYYGHDQQLEQRVVDIVEDLDMASEIAIMSLDYDRIQKLRALRPDWKIGLLSATAIGDLTKLDTDFLATSMGMATPGFVRAANAAGKPLFVWTVNDPVSMSRMISMGVDGIITDEPELARRVLAQRAGMSPAERLLVHTAELFGQPLPKRAYRDDSP